jgi:hypothetical protein
VNATLARITLELPAHQTLALAQFLKRIGWTEIRANAVDLDESYEIRAALDVLRKALAEEGFAPR